MCCRSYAQLSEEEIKLDRYAKFRALGHYEEFPVIGGQWQQARADRAAVRLLPDLFSSPCAMRRCNQ